jgi:hypothetical protein
MKELATVEEQLHGLFAAGEQQVWAGDFNALTKEDYSEVPLHIANCTLQTALTSQTAWARVGEVRARGGWEKPQVSCVSAVRVVIQPSQLLDK